MSTTNWQTTDMSESQAQKATTSNTRAQEIENACSAQTSIAVTTADITLSDAQHNGTLEFKFTGAMTAARNVICKNRPHMYLVNNTCTGGFVLTFKTAAGTGVAFNNADKKVIYCDGTNVVGGFS